jgi:hypothetical protein
MRSLMCLVSVSFFVLMGCSSSKDGGASNNAALIGVWEQTVLISPSGQKVSANKNDFKATSKNGDYTFIQLEISDKVFKIKTLESQVNKGISSHEISVSYTYENNVIKTSDSKNLQVSDYQVVEVNDREMTLKFLGEGDAISMVFVKTTKDQMEKNIKELATNTSFFIFGNAPESTLGQLDNDASIAKLKAMGVDVVIHYDYLRADDIKDLQVSLPGIASAVAKYKNDVSQIILTKAMTTSYANATKTLSVSAGNPLNNKMDQFLSNTHRLVLLQQETGVWVTGISLDIDADVDAAIKIVQREKASFASLAPYITDLHFTNTELPEIYFSNKEVNWPRPKKDSETHNLFSEAFAKASKQAAEAYGVCPKVRFHVYGKTIETKKDAENTYALIAGASKHKKMLKNICDQFDVIDLSNNPYDIPQGLSNITMQTAINEKNRILFVVFYLFFKTDSKHIDSLFNVMSELSDFEKESNATFNLESMQSGYRLNPETVQNVMQILSGKAAAVKAKNIEEIKVETFGSITLKDHVLQVSGYTEDKQKLKEKMQILNDLLQ